MAQHMIYKPKIRKYGHGPLIIPPLIVVLVFCFVFVGMQQRSALHPPAASEHASSSTAQSQNKIAPPTTGNNPALTKLEPAVPNTTAPSANPNSPTPIGPIITPPHPNDTTTPKLQSLDSTTTQPPTVLHLPAQIKTILNQVFPL